MILSQTIRLVAVLCLFISSLSMLIGTAPACLYEYYLLNTISYYHELQGGISKDPAMLGFCALVAMIFFLPLLFTYHRGWYLLICLMLFVIQTIALSMIEWGSVFEIVLVNVKYCENYWLLAWSIGQVLFWILSLIFIFHEVRD